MTIRIYNAYDLSSLITKKLIHIKRYIMATKTKQGWLWKDKKHILNSIQYCRDYLQSENIKKGDRIVYKGGNNRMVVMEYCL